MIFYGWVKKNNCYNLTKGPKRKKKTIKRMRIYVEIKNKNNFLLKGEIEN
jgi:hypothetical protein